MPESIASEAVAWAVEAAKTPRHADVQIDGTSRRIEVPYPSPQDWRDVMIYHLMLDRFNNSRRPPRTAWNRRSVEFQGGSFNGVREQLGYLAELGVGAIWISPVMKNCQYLNGTFHGYGIQDFLRLDPRFASARGREDEEFRSLVREAHGRGMYVIADVVLNHAGDVFQYDCDGDEHCIGTGGAEADWRSAPYQIFWRDERGEGRRDWTLPPAGPVSRDAVVWPRELQSNDYFRRQGRGGEHGGDFASLKEFVTAWPAVRDILIRAHQHFVAKYDVDGFRIDTLKYIERDFARIFGNAMREFGLRIGKKNFLTFGEVWDSEHKIAEFIGRHASEHTDLVGVDAALDFPLFYRLPQMAKGFSAPADVVAVFEERKRIQRGIISSHGEASRFFVTFLDNHDQKRRFRNSRETRFDDQITLGLGCLLTLQGIPCVYYGTEQGLNGTEEVYQPDAGYEDWMVREALWGKPQAFDTGHPFFQMIRRLNDVRRENPALRYGRQYFRPISGDGHEFGISTFRPGVLAFSRILNDEEMLVAANTQQAAWSGHVIVDGTLHPDGAVFNVLFSNKSSPPAAPGPVESAANVVVREPGGGVGHGPVRVIRVELKPMEIQILGR